MEAIQKGGKEYKMFSVVIKGTKQMLNLLLYYPGLVLMTPYWSPCNVNNVNPRIEKTGFDT